MRKRYGIKLMPTTNAPSALSTALGLALLLPDLEGGVMLASFCGAALLVISREQFNGVTTVFLFVVSFITGLLFADFGSAAARFLLPTSMAASISLSFGAFLVSMSITQLSLLLLKQDLPTLLSIIKNSKDNEK